MTTQSETIERRNIEAAVIGCMTLMPDAADYAAAELEGSEFSTIDLRTMFRAVSDLVRRGVPVDAITLGDELQRRGELANSGGASGIAEVLDAVPHAQHVRYYCEQLQDLHRRDCVRRTAERLTHRATDPTSSTDDTIDAAVSDLEAIRAGATRATDFITTSTALEDLDRRQNDPAAVIPTGLLSLDRMFRGGLRGGQLVVIGGRPGTGKSALMGQFVLDAGLQHRRGLFVSLEMTSAEHAERALKSMSRQRFAELPVTFAELTDLQRMLALIRLAWRRDRIEVVAVDYLQLIQSARDHNERRDQQLANITRSLKILGKELRLVVLLGSQLNRESEKRNRPCLADLRESGAIEQDADIVLLLGGDAQSPQREIILAKHRNGTCGVVECRFEGERFRFSEPDEPFGGDYLTGAKAK